MITRDDELIRCLTMGEVDKFSTQLDANLLIAPYRTNHNNQQLIKSTKYTGIGKKLKTHTGLKCGWVSGASHSLIRVVAKVLEIFINIMIRTICPRFGSFA